MKKSAILTITVVAFLGGTVITSLLNYAQGEKMDPLLSIVQAIKDLTIAIQNKQNGPTLPVAATNTGELFGSSNQLLFYGPKLCGIAGPGGLTLYIQFAGDTLVQNNNLSCPNLFGSHPIQLNGGSDVTFHKGDVLILSVNPGPNWVEVTRIVS